MCHFLALQALCGFRKLNTIIILDLFLAYFPYVEKINVGLCDHVAVCVCACVSRLSLLGNGSVKIPLSLGNGGSKLYRGNEYTRNNRSIVGRVVFNVTRVVTRKVGD
jgi:hypothetical protein